MRAFWMISVIQFQKMARREAAHRHRPSTYPKTIYPALHHRLAEHPKMKAKKHSEYPTLPHLQPHPQVFPPHSPQAVAHLAQF